MKETLHRYVCDACSKSLVAEHVPQGWLRVLSTDVKAGHPLAPNHHGGAPVVWTPSTSQPLGATRNNVWCSVDCLIATVREVAQAVLNEVVGSYETIESHEPGDDDEAT